MPHTVSYIYLRMIIHWLKRFTTFQRWLWFCRAVITVAEPTRIKNNYEKLTDKCIGIVWGRFREKTQEPAICGKECNGQGAISIGGQAIRWYFPSIIRIWYQIGRLLNIGNRLQGFPRNHVHACSFVCVCVLSISTQYQLKILRKRPHVHFIHNNLVGIWNKRSLTGHFLFFT